MGILDNYFKNIPGRDNSKKVLDMVNKKQTKKPVTMAVPKTLREKVEYAKCLSLEVFGNRLHDIELLTEERQIQEYLKAAIKNGVLAVDTETNGLDRIDGIVAGVCLYTPGEKGVYIPINHVSYMTGAPLKNNVNNNIVRQFFEECNKHKVKYILHNAKFDMHILYWLVGVKIVPYWDTLIAGYLLNENEPHGLKALWSKYCSKDNEDEKVAKFNTLFKGITFEKIPPDVGYMYASFDPIMTYDLYKFQEQYLGGHKCVNRGLERVAEVFREIEMPLIEVVFDMEVEGVTIDNHLAEQLKVKYNAVLTNAMNEFTDMINKLDEQGVFNKLRVQHPDKYAKLCVDGKLDINIGSSTQLAILFYDVLKLECPGGGRSTNEHTLQTLNHPLVSAILEYRGMSKLITTYIEAIPNHVSKRTGKLHANFNQYGAKTGRFSSDSPNLQNIPSKKKKLKDGTVIDAGHDIRQLFIAGKGNVIIGADFSQQEPRSLAHMSGDKNMINAYLEGKDLYATIASKIYKKPYEECREFRPDGTVNDKGKQRRNSVKPVLLGIMYGRGVASIAEQLNISTPEAQQIVDSFFEEFPRVKEFVEFAQENARQYGYVETAWGRKRRLPDMRLNPIELEIHDSSLLDTFNPFDFDDEVTSEVSDEVYYKYLALMNKAYGRKAREEVKELALSEGYKLTDNGGKIADAERQCVNSIIQGTAADMTKIAMIKLYRNERLRELGYKIIIPVHDEILGVCPLKNAREVREIVEHIMVHVVDDKFTVPMATDIEVTERWYGEEVNY
jgi:DNA polymerase I-like protein with 3'-5' exonuclease and polymerase domains